MREEEPNPPAPFPEREGGEDSSPLLSPERGEKGSNLITLAATWNPRGELSRLERLFGTLAEEYASLVIVVPPVADPGQVGALEKSPLAAHTGLSLVRSSVWAAGRYLAIQKALEGTASHIHYADMDRLLRWVETRPEEWRRTVRCLPDYDCLIIGRTELAYNTHPQALIQTERLSNRVVSALLGKSMDMSAGSKGFSRQAAQYLVEACLPQRALGADAEWPIRLQRAGFSIDQICVDGLDWESADRYQDQAADAEQQRQQAQAYDADPQHWAQRVEVAREIIDAALEAAGMLPVSIHENTPLSHVPFPLEGKGERGKG